MLLDTSMDAWAFGILIFELLMGRLPFEFEGNIDNFVEEMYAGFLPLDEEYPS